MESLRFFNEPVLLLVPCTGCASELLAGATTGGGLLNEATGLAGPVTVVVVRLVSDGLAPAVLLLPPRSIETSATISLTSFSCSFLALPVPAVVGIVEAGC